MDKPLFSAPPPRLRYLNMETGNKYTKATHVSHLSTTLCDFLCLFFRTLVCSDKIVSVKQCLADAITLVSDPNQLVNLVLVYIVQSESNMKDSTSAWHTCSGSVLPSAGRGVKFQNRERWKDVWPEPVESQMKIYSCCFELCFTINM